MASLMKKSMIFVDSDDGRLRLLETTRDYAREKLKEAGEFRRTAELHATYYCNFIAAEEVGWEERAPEQWLTKYGNLIDDVRSALTWAFSPVGDRCLGIEMAANSAALWFQLFLLEEYVGWAERGIAASLDCRSSDKRRLLQLVAALGYALLHTKGPVPQMAEAFQKTLALSNELGVSGHSSRAYRGLCAQKLFVGDYESALALTEQFIELHGSPESLVSVPTIKRMKALALHYLGQTPVARRLLEGVLAESVKSSKRTIDSAFYFDDRVAAMAQLGATLWVEGFPSRAIQAAEASVKEALSIDHMPSLCYALALSACPISLWMGDDAKGAEFIELLLTKSREHRLEFSNLWGRSYAAVLAQRKGAVIGLGDVPHLYLETRPAGPLREIIATLCATISDSRLYEEAEQQSGWCRPELLRVKGELLQGDPDVVAQQAAELALLRSLKLAREQGAMSWEIRTAVSLARLWKASRRLDARNVIEEVLGRIVDPYQTTDICTARRLYEELRLVITKGESSVS